MATSLESLPAEIQLAVLSWLPVRDIQKCRRVNQYFRQLIDLEENQSLCVGPSITKSLARLKAFTDKYCDYPLDRAAEDGTPTGFLDALVDFVALRGIIDGGKAQVLFEDRLEKFAKHWIFRHTGEVRQPWEYVSWRSEIGSQVGTIVAVVKNLVQYHQRHDIQPVGEAVRNYLVGLSEEDLQLVRLREPKDMSAWLDMVTGEPGVFSHVSIVPAAQYSRIGPMSWGIVPRAARMSDNELATQTNKRAKALGIPEMPETSPFKYMVRTTWARDHVQAAVTAKVDNIVKAAVLEELFLQEKPKAKEWY